MIRVESMCFSVGEFRLRDASLEIDDGEYFVLLGPPGSGKSIFLECLCGLNRVEHGRVFIDQRDVTHLEPRRRNIGYVPQDYALFPHLSVEQNIGSGLLARRQPTGHVRQRTAELAQMLGIDHLLSRRIAGLSGGERQRVALARALVIDPSVLLLDEPVSALDESTREKVCSELRQLQQKMGITTIHVSHNLEEAFSVADRGAVLRGGQFQQIGLLQDLLRRPATEYVAGFMRCENILVGQVSGTSPEGNTRVAVGDAEFLIPGQHEGQVTFVIRPENVHLAGHEGSGDPRPQTRLPVRLERSIDRGAYIRAELRGALRLVAHVPHQAFVELGTSPGSALTAVVLPEAIHVLQ